MKLSRHDDRVVVELATSRTPCGYAGRRLCSNDPLFSASRQRTAANGGPEDTTDSAGSDIVTIEGYVTADAPRREVVVVVERLNDMARRQNMSTNDPTAATSAPLLRAGVKDDGDVCWHFTSVRCSPGGGGGGGGGDNFSVEDSDGGDLLLEDSTGGGGGGGGGGDLEEATSARPPVMDMLRCRCSSPCAEGRVAVSTEELYGRLDGVAASVAAAELSAEEAEEREHRRNVHVLSMVMFHSSEEVVRLMAKNERWL
jgi:hypothetical protein